MTPDELADDAMRKLGLRIPSQPDRQRRTDFKKLACCLLAAILWQDNTIGAKVFNLKYHERTAKSNGPDWHHYDWHLEQAAQYRTLIDLEQRLKAGETWHDIAPTLDAALERHRTAPPVKPWPGDEELSELALVWKHDHSHIMAALKGAVWRYHNGEYPPKA